MILANVKYISNKDEKMENLGKRVIKGSGLVKKRLS